MEAWMDERFSYSTYESSAKASPALLWALREIQNSYGSFSGPKLLYSGSGEGNSPESTRGMFRIAYQRDVPN